MRREEGTLHMGGEEERGRVEPAWNLVTRKQLTC